MKIISLDPYSFIIVPDETTEEQIKLLHPRTYFNMVELILDRIEIETTEKDETH